MLCENCGNQIPDDSVFCEGCGTRVEPDAPAYNMQQQVPKYAPQPTDYYGQQPMQQPYPTKKTPVGMIIGIAAAVVVIGVGGFFGIRALIGNNDPAPVAEVSPSVSDIVTPATPEVTPTPEPVVSPAAPEETPTPEPQQENPFEDYRGYASGDEASIGDFFWFTEDVMWSELPANRTAITEFSAISGYWKAYTESVIIIGDGTHYRWFNAEISGEAGSAAFTFHTNGFFGLEAQIGKPMEEYDLSFLDGERYNGSFSAGQLVVGNRDTKGLEITIKDFYTIDGVQYAVGETIYISGEKEYILLVRP